MKQQRCLFNYFPILIMDSCYWHVAHVTQVLSRLAPFERGIFEDYVANFWCASSVLIKWKRLFTTDSLKLISFTATVITCLPSMIQQIKSPSYRGFLYALLNSSFSFYLFSFQGWQYFFSFIFQSYEKKIIKKNLMRNCLFTFLPSQCMRSLFCCLCFQQPCWLLKSLLFSSGSHNSPCSPCFL